MRTSSIRWSARSASLRAARAPRARDARMLLREYPLRPELLAVTRVGERRANGMRGRDQGRAGGRSPRCAAADFERAAHGTRDVEALAQHGVRVLGGRRRRNCGGAELPGSLEAVHPRLSAWSASPIRCASRCRRGARMPRGRHPRGDDHRRLSGDGARHRARRRASRTASVLSGADLAALDDAALARRVRGRVSVFARIAPDAEAAHRQRAQGQRRSGGDDRRRRQRRAGAQGGAHRHRHGRARHRRGARGGLAGAARRRLRLHRARRPAGTPHLRQPAQGHGLHPRRARADRRAGAAAGAVRLAADADAHAHRAARAHHRPGLFGGAGSRARGARRDAPAAAPSAQRACCRARSCHGRYCRGLWR